MIRRVAFVALVGVAIAACAGIGEGLEARFLARIRVQNPNDVAIAYSGLSAEIDLNVGTLGRAPFNSTGEIELPTPAPSGD